MLVLIVHLLVREQLVPIGQCEWRLRGSIACPRPRTAEVIIAHAHGPGDGGIEGSKGVASLIEAHARRTLAALNEAAGQP